MDFLYAFFLKRFLTVWKILVFDLLNMLRGLTIVYTAFNIKFLKSFGQITYVYILPSAARGGRSPPREARINGNTYI